MDGSAISMPHWRVPVKGVGARKPHTGEEMRFPPAVDTHFVLTVPNVPKGPSERVDVGSGEEAAEVARREPHQLHIGVDYEDPARAAAGSTRERPQRLAGARFAARCTRPAPPPPTYRAFMHRRARCFAHRHGVVGAGIVEHHEFVAELFGVGEDAFKVAVRSRLISYDHCPHAARRRHDLFRICMSMW